MAKGSLLGKADPTLAGMSTKEALAGVPQDMKGIYDQELANVKEINLGVQLMFDNMYADHNALRDELKEATARSLENLSQGATPNDEVIELYNGYLGDVKQRLKKIPKGKKGDLERAKIRAEVSRLQSSSENMDKTLLTLGKMIDNDQFDHNATGGKNMAILTAIANGHSERAIINGNLVHSIPDPANPGEMITLTQADLKEMLVETDPKWDQGFEKIGQGANGVGKQKGTTWDKKRQGYVNSYFDYFNTKKNFARTINKPQGGMQYSFIDSLTGKDGSTTIFDALKEMPRQGYLLGRYDANNDGVINDEDFTTAPNATKLISALTNIHDEEFDFQTAKALAAEFYADGLAQNEFQDGVNMRAVDKEKEEEETLTDAEKYWKDIGQGRRIGLEDRYYYRRTLQNIYSDMLEGQLEFEDVAYTYDMKNKQWVGEGIDQDNEDDYGKVVFEGSQEEFVRNQLQIRDPFWTDAEINIEEYHPGGKKKKKPKQKFNYTADQWDSQGDTYLTVGHLTQGDDDRTQNTLNAQLPKGVDNPEGWNFSVGSDFVHSKVYLEDGSGNRITWRKFKDKYGWPGDLPSRNGEEVSVNTDSKQVNEQRKQLKILLNILKQVIYETEGGEWTSLYDQFEPLSDWRREMEGGNEGGDDTEIDTSNY
tara:strand:+ start:56 stop:2011 length:1956 start_codon:yes stop_codon:yes gene_type:complete